MGFHCGSHLLLFMSVQIIYIGSIWINQTYPFFMNETFFRALYYSGLIYSLCWLVLLFVHVYLLCYASWIHQSIHSCKSIYWSWVIFWFVIVGYLLVIRGSGLRECRWCRWVLGFANPRLCLYVILLLFNDRIYIIFSFVDR